MNTAVETSAEFGWSGAIPTPAQYEARFRTWLGDNADELAAIRNARPFSVEERAAALRPLHHRLYAAGWLRWGWPEQVGGYGGPALL